MHFRFLYVFDQLFLGLATITPANVYFVDNKKTPVQLAVLQNNRTDYYICAIEMTIWIIYVTYNSKIG